MDGTMFTIVFSSVTAVIYLGFIIHIVYVVVRNNRERARGMRRSRYPQKNLILYDVVFIFVVSAIGAGFFGMARYAIETRSTLVMIILTIIFTVGVFAVIGIAAILCSLATVYVDIKPSGFTFRNKIGKVRKIPFSAIGGYSFRRFLLGKTDPSAGGHLQLIGTTGEQLFKVQIRSTSVPEYVGQYIMFRTVQGRWPQLGDQEDEQTLASYTADEMIPFYKTYYWRSDF